MQHDETRQQAQEILASFRRAAPSAEDASRQPSETAAARDERADRRWIEAQEQDPERWDGLS